jgi:hypothetical protein
MIAFAFVDADGIPTGGGILPNLPEGAIELAAPFGTLDLPRIRWRNGAWEKARRSGVARATDRSRAGGAGGRPDGTLPSGRQQPR